MTSFVRFLRRARARRLSRDLPLWEAASVDRDSGHVVQFYGGDFPAGTVAGFLREGIDQGEVCIVVATPEHIKAIDSRLERPGKVVYQDAEATMAKFMVDGRPHRLRFLDTVGDMVAQAAQAGGGKVRAFGEMVVLLCQQGNPQAAHELEVLWNEIAARHSLRLLCSYPVTSVEGPARTHAAALRDTHSHIVPAT